MTLLLRSSNDLPSAETYEYWCSPQGQITALPADKILPNLEYILETKFEKSRGEWLRIGRLLQSDRCAQYAHMPTAGSFGSDFGIMLAWSDIARELSETDTTILMVTDDPWLFRHIVELPRVSAGKTPAFWPRTLKFIVRGVLAKTKVALAAMFASIKTGRYGRATDEGKSAILVYGHPESDAEGGDAYFGNLMDRVEGLQRILHTDCTATRALVLRGDGRTVSLHMWGGFFFAAKLVLTWWRPNISGELGHYKHLIRRSAALENSGGGPAMNRWQDHCQRNWIKTMRPATIAWPWENHGWERNLVRASRRVGVRTIGHQHTVIGPHQFNYSVETNEDGLDSVPDQIICSGSAYLAELRDAGFPEERLAIGGALRFVRPSSDPYDPDGPVFIALSAIRAVSEAMLAAAKQLAASGLDVMVKEHPMYPIAFDEQNNLSRTNTSLNNQSSISAVVYATGTVGVEAHIMNIPAVRLLLKDRVSINVLPAGFQNATATQQTLPDVIANIERPAVTDTHAIFAEPKFEYWESLMTADIN